MRWPKAFPHPALVFVVLAWGLNFAVIKVAYHDFSPPALALLRFLGMWPILILACLLSGANLRYPSRESVGKLLWAGFLASGLYMVLFLEGMQRTSAAQGAITLSTAPIFIGIFSVLARQERFRLTLLIGSMIAFAGVAVVVVAGGGQVKGSLLGAGLVLASAIVWAYSVIVMRPLLAGMHALSAFTLTFPGAAIALIPYGAKAVAETKWGEISFVGWIALGYLVVVAGVLAFVAYYRGVADVGPNATSMTQFFIPPTAALGAWLLLGQPMTVGQAIGLAIVIGGVVYASRRSRTPEAADPIPEAPSAIVSADRQTQ